MFNDSHKTGVSAVLTSLYLSRYIASVQTFSRTHIRENKYRRIRDDISISIHFLARGKPSTMMYDLQHHSSDEAFSPMGALRCLNMPCGRRKNVVMSELFGLRASWKYPCTASNFAKQVAVLGIACKILAVQGNGCTNLLTCLLRCV